MGAGASRADLVARAKQIRQEHKNIPHYLSLCPLSVIMDEATLRSFAECFEIIKIGFVLGSGIKGNSQFQRHRGPAFGMNQ